MVNNAFVHMDAPFNWAIHNANHVLIIVSNANRMERARSAFQSIMSRTEPALNVQLIALSVRTLKIA